MLTPLSHIRHSLREQKGFALISALIASVLVIGISAVGYQIVSTQIRAQQALSGMGYQSVLRSQIQAIIEDSKKCGPAMLDSSGNRAKFDPGPIIAGPGGIPPIRPTTLAQISLPGLTLSKNGQTVNGVTVVSHRIYEVVPSNRTSDTKGTLPILKIPAILEIRIERHTSGSANPLAQTLTFPLAIALNDSTSSDRNTITDCASSPERLLSSIPPNDPPGPLVITENLSDSNEGAGVNCNSTMENAGKLYLFAIGSYYALAIAPKRIYTAHVKCPTGKRVISGGAQCGSGFSWTNGIASFVTGGLMGGPAPGNLVTSQPMPTGEGWSVACCIEGWPATTNKAYAMCVD